MNAPASSDKPASSDTPLTAPPIPPTLWVRLVDFLNEHRSGQLVLHVNRGAVSRVQIIEEFRPLR